MWRTVLCSRRFRIPLTLILALATVTGLPLWPAAVAAPAVRVTAIGVKVFPGVVQVAISGSGPLRFRASTMADPFRVLIDLPGARLAETVPAVLPVAQPPVLRVRAGQFQQGVVRVVIDLSAPTAYEVSSLAPSVLAARLMVPLPAAKPKPPAVAAAVPPAAPPPIAAPATTLPAPALSPVPATRVGNVAAQAPSGAPGRITVDLRNAEIADVLSALAKLCGFNIVTDGSVKGAITVRLVDVTCDEALRFILDANNLAFRRVGNNLLVMAAEKLAPPPEVPEPVIYPLGFADAEKVRAAIAASVPGVRVAIDQRTNTLIVFGTTAQHEQVRKILAALDIQIPQVMVEVRVVDISTDVLRDLGLEWGLTGYQVNFTGVTATGGIPATLTISTAAPVDLGVTLTALVRDRKARVLSAPRVAVIDGNKATVNLGEEIPVPQRDAQGNITFTFKPVGVNLEITPRVNRDGIITTVVAPEVSSVLTLLSTPAGPVPQIASRKASTTVQVKSGESIIIAGMISAQERETIIKVPLLGDIPVIGSLFRRTTTERTESEVIFVITPTLLPVTK
ncbi:MAG: AMIN domain-containing protein [Armatimonadota bacterium]|nr:AMIN domain-containing protein [Armatimonadota bacterium]MDR7428156.1 AMIN domain-containing protein [Armatimonadota bacterium]MDR7470964.1 AMIN domain-containing protein [Armatimonadota bacterium]MDR7473639.1 AMIN domain-containing protein [Armatimonadota bacterium]MDR7538840.1 AMIN domain-containing protein [Armatimonadota bacterium]